MAGTKKPAAPRQITVRPPPDQMAELEARAGEERGAGLTSVAQAAIGRYLEICRREVPPLSEPQWNLIRDALNGIWLLEEPRSVAWIDHEIEDAIRLNKLDAKHGVDAEAMLAAVRSWGYAQRVAVVDAVERWWRGR